MSNMINELWLVPFSKTACRALKPGRQFSFDRSLFTQSPDLGMVGIPREQQLLYGTPNLNCVSKSTLLYQGNQYVVSSWLIGKAIISVKLVFTVFTL